MKRVISKDLITWYKIRDLIISKNYHIRDIPKALELAKTCNHPDALWLNNVCKDKEVNSIQTFREILKSLENDGNALLFLYILDVDKPSSKIIKSAELGCVYAKWVIYYNFNIIDHGLKIEEIKKYDEREAYYVLARYENRKKKS